jgi:serine phosphatase RsbU (regulator of sigma subunit)
VRDDEHTELGALRRRAADDAELIGELRDQLAHDATEIADLRRRLGRYLAAADAHRAAQAALIARLRDEADVRDAELAEVQSRLAASEIELDDLRAVRDALTPAELPDRPGLQIAASFVPATQRVSGDFYLAAPGSGDATVVVVGDVVGKGVAAARDAAFLRAAFATIARYSDDPSRLLGWANAAFREVRHRRMPDLRSGVAPPALGARRSPHAAPPRLGRRAAGRPARLAPRRARDGRMP